MTSQTENKEDYLYKLRHSAAHVLAEAVKDLFPDTKLTIGPPTEDGFYYDFDSTHRFVPEDLEAIEKKMRFNLRSNNKFLGEEISRENARKYWAEKNEKYKVEIIDDLPPDAKITLYKHGKFTDLCKGNHLEDTKDIKYFKLTKIAGAYWRGDEKREQLQRIYGTIWPSEQELKDYLHQQEEAKKRDHRELGPRLGLFSIHPDEVGSGLVLWHPKGAFVRHLIEDYLKALHLKSGYQLAVSPHVGLSNLWQTSGHLSFYKENMFQEMKVENQSYYVKPMTCPFHITIYKTDLHSYRELPIRLYEHGTVYRYERSGVLHGLLRVRGFTQDDSHLFCRFDQLQEEIRKVLMLARQILQDFGFNNYEVKLSTRPDKYVGQAKIWDQAESFLSAALKDAGFNYDVDPGEGTFYGPKIDLKIKDSLGRKWQCSTVQLDFNLPERFQATYRNEEGKETPVVMVHRAILGSIERFFGILVEHYAGAFPLWLAPVQVAVLPISDKQLNYAKEVTEQMTAAGFRTELHGENEKVGAKIRKATLEKIPYMVVVGDKEVEAHTIAVRTRVGKDLGTINPKIFLAQLAEEVAKKRSLNEEIPN
ncbi:MAG: Threonine--tRNA ligase [Elusimicrobia bacterium]|nr:Threonine--tRNA ligase [Elusimicrobiota bacterium]